MTVEHFNEWYSSMDGSGERDRLWQRMLGLPAELVSSSLLSMSALLEIAELLELGPNDVLLDLACGRGGYGLWLARETGCRLVGVDFSDVAVADASRRIADFGVDGRAEFAVGELEAIGLPDASVDAVVCVDAIQFAGNTAAAATEVRRVLRPGGTAVLTSWQALDRSDEALPARIRNLDLASALPAGGLVDVAVVDRPDWLEVEGQLWTAVLTIDPDGDPALVDAREEAELVMPDVLAREWRVLATGRAPL